MKLKNIFTMMVFVLCLTVQSICIVWAENTEHIVTDDDKHIKDEAGLRKLSTMVNDWGIEFKDDIIYLEDDIMLDDTAFIPIGNSTYHFKGSFEGDGHTISNMHINNIDGVDFYGLFGVTENANINFVRLSDIKIDVSKAAQEETKSLCVGGLVGLGGNTDIMMCSVESGNITTAEIEQDDSSYTGGLSGLLLNCSVRFCGNNATIYSSTDNIGGIAAAVQADNGMDNIEYCCNSGNITSVGASSIAGGLAAANSAGGITDSYNSGRVIGKDGNSRVAGTVVANYNTASRVYNCIDMCSENISYSTNVGQFYIIYANTKDEYKYYSYNYKVDDSLETVDMVNLSELEILEKVNKYSPIYVWAVNYGRPVLWWQAINGNDAVIRGDVSGDGNLGPKDIALILKHISQASVLTGDRLLCADYNADNKVDLKDVILIMNNKARYFSYVTT